jgi:cell wall-associated NlpC family hydrolase
MSGKGKHRRRSPRRLPTSTVTAATVLATGTLVCVAAPVAEAAPASSEGDQWDKVAQCESGGNWNTNTGNGFSGGLQFTDSTWRSHGGSTPHAYQASKAEQKRVAERVLRDQGWRAWPTCGHGLTASAAVKTTTVTSRPKPPQPAASSPPVAEPAPAPAVAPPAADAPPPADYTVAEDDTLIDIAARLHVPDADGVPGWQRIATANLDKVTDPAVIQPQTHLRIPQPAPALPPDWAVATHDTENLLAQLREMIGPAPVTPVVAAVAVLPPAPAGPAQPAEVPQAVPAAMTVDLAAQVVQLATAQKGTPYVTGGQTPGKAFDCSGLVMWAYARIGIQLPRVAADQSRVGSRVAGAGMSKAALLRVLRPGDLLFFYSPVEHVVMYVGNGMIVEAAHSGVPVHVVPLYTNGFVGARRVL